MTNRLSKYHIDLPILDVQLNKVNDNNLSIPLYTDYKEMLCNNYKVAQLRK